MIDYRKFRHGDIVKYVSDQYGDSIWNPIWNGEYGRIKGTVHGNTPYRTTNVCCITVTWKNGERNTYSHDDLLLVGEEFLGNKDFEL
jgi:hypothetical protein